MTTEEKCNAYSGVLNCGCCDAVSTHCEKPKGHDGKHRGEYWDGVEIVWRAKK